MEEGQQDESRRKIRVHLHEKQVCALHSGRKCAHKTVLYGSTTAVAKADFDFIPQTTDKRSKSRHPRPEPVSTWCHRPQTAARSTTRDDPWRWPRHPEGRPLLRMISRNSTCPGSPQQARPPVPSSSQNRARQHRRTGTRPCAATRSARRALISPIY